MPLESLDDPTIRRELDNLRQEGITHCRVGTQGRLMTAVSTARRTLGPTPGRAPDGVVYCTDTIETSPTLEAGSLLAGIGCTTSTLVVAGGNACGNLGTGLDVAAGRLATGRARTVLLVTADEVVRGTRYLVSGGTALSDGAASCLVSTEPVAGAYRVLGLTSGSSHVGSQGASSLPAAAQSIDKTVAETTAAAGLGLDDYRYVLTGNLGRMMRSFIAMAARLSLDKVHAPQAATVGHCFAADILVELADLARCGAVAAGDRLLLVPTSPSSWCAIAVEFTG